MYKMLEKPRVVGRVSHIAFHPVKSARLIEVLRATLTPEGIEGDRQFMVVMKEPDSDGVHNFVTQRTSKERDQKRAAGLPILALIRPELRDGALRLDWMGRDPIDVPLDINSGNELTVGIWGDVVRTVDQGDKFAEWLSEHLGMEVRFVKASGSFQRSVSQKWTENSNTLRFQDGYPIHWFTEGSINELSRMVGEEMSWRRFRPNLVVQGEAQIEHQIYQGELSGIPFLQPKPCDRCLTTTVDQDTGETHKRMGPLRSLMIYKAWRNKEGKRRSIFGENMLPQGRGEIKVGDELMMMALRDPPLIYGAENSS